MAKNIVITGANGFLTSNLISKLDKNKYNITTIGISHLDDINIHDKHK